MSFDPPSVVQLSGSMSGSQGQHNTGDEDINLWLFFLPSVEPHLPCSQDDSGNFGLLLVSVYISHGLSFQFISPVFVPLCVSL